MTEEFYPQVAKLTAQISMLLKPLTDYLYLMPPRHGRELPRIEDQYQSLHNLISRAAYLSLCIRLSPTIFYFNDINPGSVYDDKDHHSLENELYTESRDAVLDAHRVKLAAWQQTITELNNRLTALETAGRTESRDADAARRALASHQSNQPNFSAMNYRAMAKIGVWPVITRYTPGGEADDDLEGGKYLRDKDGFRILLIGKGAMVAYYGWNVDGNGGLKDPSGARVRLREWVRRKEVAAGIRKPKTGKLSKMFRFVGGAAAVGAAAYGFGLSQYPVLADYDWVESFSFLLYAAMEKGGLLG